MGLRLILLHRVEGATLLIGGSINVQQSIHLHLFALICIYAAYKMHGNKQISLGKHIYI